MSYITNQVYTVDDVRANWDEDETGSVEQIGTELPPQPTTSASYNGMVSSSAQKDKSYSKAFYTTLEFVHGFAAQDVV